MTRSSSSATPCKLVILVSGGGSNLQSFIDGVSNGSLTADIAAVFSNRPKAFGLERAANAGIATEAIDHTLFESREAFDAELMQRIDHYAPDLVILAGFMRILTPGFVQNYHGRLLNIHPSLLPKYPGLHTHQRAIDAGDPQAGATVHFVTEELDGGPAIVQAAVPIEAGDNADLLAKRVLTQEHIIYPLAAQWFAEGRLRLESNSALLDNTPLSAGGYQYND
ncbi:phosphoribosylglycinamide formyltransferase [Oceanicoccus sagamiensis]|uniref:Phosphoribosylglycinamide formyltransferase n=1 Tax=Oceanicoccus sagamiensis TaxID=716816 RepID=A0A1X9N6W3_9GAMM|nr:phosphoribosylglycinamide formyltransferase [Oceanicoccus sagamiensis]ARN72971.1 phosphoribosylglycinamide formyltransferase [Oceanicoccus sagamiensis]